MTPPRAAAKPTGRNAAGPAPSAGCGRSQPRPYPAVVRTAVLGVQRVRHQATEGVNRQRLAGFTPALRRAGKDFEATIMKGPGTGAGPKPFGWGAFPGFEGMSIASSYSSRSILARPYRAGIGARWGLHRHPIKQRWDQQHEKKFAPKKGVGSRKGPLIEAPITATCGVPTFSRALTH